MKAIGSLHCGFYGTTSFTAIFHRHFISLDFHAYASSGVLPPRLQGLIPGLWLAVTRAGFLPARTHDIAMSLLITSLSTTPGPMVRRIVDCAQSLMSTERGLSHRDIERLGPI